MNKPLFTIFTPVYNRKNTVHRVWESLNKQTFSDFEWIVVDDASTDGVKVLLESYKEKADFPVNVHYHEHNKGKHFAWNYAVKEAQGKFFVPADADDSFVPETLERFFSNWNSISLKEQETFSGINVLCKDVDTDNIIGDKYPEAPLVSNNLELTYRKKISGEKWGMIKTEALRKYPLPEVETSCGYYPESYIWFSLAKSGFKVLCVNEPLRYYYTDTENSVLTLQRKNPIKSSAVICHYTTWHLNNNLIYMISSTAFKDVLKYYLRLIRNGLLIDYSIIKQFKSLTGALNKLLYVAAATPGVIIYYFTYRKYKIR